MEMKLELVIIPVTDIERAKIFYTKKLGFHADVDMNLKEHRFVQLTPPGSACSIAIGNGITKAKPGSVDSLLLVVTDIQKVHDGLVKLGVKVTEVEKMPWGALHIYFSDPDGNKWSIQQKPDRNKSS
jgi:catechol 2,3-dioxygenase-like lactoylglutathione lyase family enzyme